MWQPRVILVTLPSFCYFSHFQRRRIIQSKLGAHITSCRLLWTSRVHLIYPLPSTSFLLSLSLCLYIIAVYILLPLYKYFYSQESMVNSLGERLLQLNNYGAQLVIRVCLIHIHARLYLYTHISYRLQQSLPRTKLIPIRMLITREIRMHFK